MEENFMVHVYCVMLYNYIPIKHPLQRKHA